MLPQAASLPEDGGEDPEDPGPGRALTTGELTQLNVQAQKALSNLGLDFLYKI